MNAKTKRINPNKEGTLMSGYALNMLMKWDLCATISNPSGYAIVRESGRSNRALKVAA